MCSRVNRKLRYGGFTVAPMVVRKPLRSDFKLIFDRKVPFKVVITLNVTWGLWSIRMNNKDTYF